MPTFSKTKIASSRIFFLTKNGLFEVIKKTRKINAATAHPIEKCELRSLRLLIILECLYRRCFSGSNHQKPS